MWYAYSHIFFTADVVHIYISHPIDSRCHTYVLTPYSLQAHEEEAAAHVEVQLTVKQMEETREKLSAQVAQAAKEHADSVARSAEATRVGFLKSQLYSHCL